MVCYNPGMKNSEYIKDLKTKLKNTQRNLDLDLGLDVYKPGHLREDLPTSFQGTAEGFCSTVELGPKQVMAKVREIGAVEKKLKELGIRL